MRQLTIAVLLLVAVGLQSALRSVWQPFGYVDLALILVVYFALQRQPLQALIVGAAAGLLTDIMTGRPALLGAGGFSKTLTAYAVYFVASRVMLDTPILRIPVLASASLIDNAVYVGMHRLLGQPPPMPFIQSLSYKLIATTVAGTILLYGYESFFSTRARQRRQFTIRRRVARGSSSGLRRRSR
ncbi:MAG: rod shape-determining protein MreD [Blastocatellia bacterium]|jgi:rod shape-determining protein MreD|nr:rod shape-determining protein MreD [Blastocatellia bacterium]